ncbi:uncharacterized protein yc1106_01271 [Curvularia clavata]|uniref:BHLH domain-containing protein n=1 Tax=Curvularia clavata TaxID=95742 RepID=A0A9Q8Z1H0_CURCL|nr:uncharacterized protein yc1106_01271 [Curvularia clavata]
MRQNFSPFKESVIAEQKIQELRQTQSATNYTTLFQQELMRSRASINTLEELIEESIQLDNELYELSLEERLFSKGTRNQRYTNERPKKHSYQHAHPNKGRQRNYAPRTLGAYHRYSAEPMHLNNINKGNGPSKFNKEPSKGKKKFNYYAYGKEDHIARDYRSKDTNKNVITPAKIQYHPDDERLISGLKNVTLTTSKDTTKAKLNSDEGIFILEVPLKFKTDASDLALGGCASIYIDSKWHPIAYYSKKLSGPEERYDFLSGFTLEPIYDSIYTSVSSLSQHPWTPSLRSDDPQQFQAPSSLDPSLRLIPKRESTGDGAELDEEPMPKRPRRKRGQPRLDRSNLDTSTSSKCHRTSCLPHSQVERKYREGLNAELERLRRAVPTLPQRDECGVLGQSKPSKAMVLASAIDYIKNVTRERDMYRVENERLTSFHKQD